MSNKNRKNVRKLVVTASLFKFKKKVKLHHLHGFLPLSNILSLLQRKKTLHKVIFLNSFELDPDPHSEKLLDPDLQKMIADTQP